MSDRGPRRAIRRGRTALLALIALVVTLLAGMPWALHGGDDGRPRHERVDLESALLPPWWAPHTADERATVSSLAASRGRPPRPWLGTDRLGRDLMARTIVGGGVSLGVGLGAALVATVLGSLVGAVAGSTGGRVDGMLMRGVDVLQGLPTILLVVLVGLAATGAIERLGVDLSPTSRRLAELLTLVLAIGAVSWLTMARVVRGRAMTLARQPFLEAARAVGMGPVARLFRHLLPNLRGTILVYATLAVPAAILSESFLSFLGLGVREPLPSWGSLAAAGVAELSPVRSRWWLLVVPCLGIAGLLVLLQAVAEPTGRRRARRAPVRAMASTAPTAPPGTSDARPDDDSAGGAAAPSDERAPRLDVRGLSVDIAGRPVLRGIDLQVQAGQVVALVGASGSGKTMTGLALLDLLPPDARVTGGSARLDGRALDLGHAGAGAADLDRRAARGGHLSMIFQQPRASLHPMRTIGAQVVEAVRHHRSLRGGAAIAAARTLLEEAGFADGADRLHHRPDQLSGGECQRVMIALALAGRPRVLFADEPTTALDVLVQGRLLEHLRTLARRTGLGVVLVTHDLHVVAEIADVAVIVDEGRTVERATCHELFDAPRHPATRRLLAHTGLDAPEHTNAVPSAAVASPVGTSAPTVLRPG